MVGGPLRRLRRGGDRPALLRLDDALAAVGDQGAMGRYVDEVPLDQVLGSVARSADFDHRFRPQARTARYTRVLERFGAGDQPPPIELVRLGELYFVVDGHHRVAAARERGWTHLPAAVRRICTVAYACSCLTVADLAAKGAERRFLAEVPLPDDVGRQLWLDRPADWARLTDAALAWAWRRQRDGGPGDDTAPDPHDLASAWWAEEVIPTVDRLRDSAPCDLVDVQVYVTALGRRDGIADLAWPSPHCCPDHLACQDAC